MSRVDYTTVALTDDPKKLAELGIRFGKIAKYIETAYGNIPQDIEGALVTTN